MADFPFLRRSIKVNGLQWKDPEDVVTDYLTKVFEYLDEAFDVFGSHLRQNIPVDIVVTVPVVSPLCSSSAFIAWNGERLGADKYRYGLIEQGTQH